MRAVSVNAEAYEAALSLGKCMLNFKAQHRAERDDPLRKAELDQKERTECNFDEQQKVIAARLRVAHPSMSDQQLANEHKNVVILAMFAAYSERKSSENSNNAPNQ